ncbi:MAG: hypothetical protein KGJ34_00750 [Patescibacteria group bacterium]|nr:hypothetical protein [Patescibacteria group bacterium]
MRFARFCFIAFAMATLSGCGTWNLEKSSNITLQSSEQVSYLGTATPSASLKNMGEVCIYTTKNYTKNTDLKLGLQGDLKDTLAAQGRKAKVLGGWFGENPMTASCPALLEVDLSNIGFATPTEIKAFRAAGYGSDVNIPTSLQDWSTMRTASWLQPGSKVAAGVLTLQQEGDTPASAEHVLVVDVLIRTGDQNAWTDRWVFTAPQGTENWRGKIFWQLEEKISKLFQ